MHAMKVEITMVHHMWRISILLPSFRPIKFHVNLRFEVRNDGFEQSIDQVRFDANVTVFEEIDEQTLTRVE